MPFNFTWNTTFLDQPSDNEDISLGAGRIRDLKSAITERMLIDHSWAGDAEDGKHNQVTLRVAAGDPTIDAGETTDGILYTKAVSGASELFFENSAHALQLTAAGAINIVPVPSGTVLPYAGSTAPSGYLFANGQAVSRTTYATLFAALGTTYGAGDGATTFNVPDLRGRVAAGVDNMGAIGAAGRLGSGPTGGVTTPATLGAVGGEQSHTLTGAESGTSAHGHGVTNTLGVSISGGAVRLGSTQAGQPLGLDQTSFPQTEVGSPISGPTLNPEPSASLSGSVSVNNSVAASASSDHNNVQPTLILNYIIKT